VMPLDSYHVSIFPSANALSVAKAVAPTSITAIVATMNMYLLFILIKNRRLCLFTLSKSELFY
jgi:hypothetical protein